jgi:hypothetical protein
MIASADGSIRMDFIAVSRFDDPRMNTASFRVDGPDVHAESTIDAYMIEKLFSQAEALLSGSEKYAGSIAGELTFERQKTGEIVVSLSGGPYASGARAWSCSFAAAPHSVAAFVMALVEEFNAAEVRAV